MSVNESKVVLELIHDDFNNKLNKFCDNINNLFTNNSFIIKLKNFLKRTKHINNLTKQIINYSSIQDSRDDSNDDHDLDFEDLVDKYPAIPPTLEISMDSCRVKFELLPVYDEDLCMIDSSTDYKTNKYCLRLVILVILHEYKYNKNFKMKYYFSQNDINNKNFLKNLKSYFTVKLKRCESCDNVSDWFFGRTCLSCQYSEREIIDCSICRQDRDVIKKNIYTTECNHKFHVTCFKQYWRSGNAEDKDDNMFIICPNCRGKVDKLNFNNKHRETFCCHPESLD
jgi:hypothetical protein